MIVDCAVHPLLDDAALRHAIGAPWNLAKLPNPLGDLYPTSFDQLAAPANLLADPAGFTAALFDASAAGAAVLSPSARGYFPNPQQAAAFAGGCNSLLSERWLSCPEAGGRFFGSIRVALNNTGAAVREIERWAGDLRFVQVVVPLRALAPYGDERYFPIWRLASENGLPVFLHDDPATLVEPTPTPVGHPIHYAEHHALRPLAGVVHLASLITTGVFGRLPDLRVILGDGGVDVARALFWRLDKDWRSGRIEIPWVTDAPSSFLPHHVRFVSQPEDAAADGFEPASELVAAAAPVVLFGSRFPYWDHVDAASAFADWAAEARDRVLGLNAIAFHPRLAHLATAPSR